MLAIEKSYPDINFPIFYQSYPDINFPIFYQLISLVLDNFIRLTNSLDIIVIADFN